MYTYPQQKRDQQWDFETKDLLYWGCFLLPEKHFQYAKRNEIKCSYWHDTSILIRWKVMHGGTWIISVHRSQTPQVYLSAWILNSQLPLSLTSLQLTRIMCLKSPEHTTNPWWATRVSLRYRDSYGWFKNTWRHSRSIKSNGVFNLPPFSGTCWSAQRYVCRPGRMWLMVFGKSKDLRH